MRNIRWGGSGNEFSRVRVLAALGIVALSASALSGCSAEAGDGGEAESVDSVSEASVAGNWVTPPPDQGSVFSDTGSKVGNLEVCRAYYQDGWQPGKVWHDSAFHAMCEFGWGGAAHYAVWTDTRKPAPYQVLRDAGYKWVNPNPNGLSTVPYMSTAVDGGDAGPAAGHAHTQVCEAYGPDGNWHPGKFYNQYCLYGYGGGPENNYGVERKDFPGTYDHVRLLSQ